MATYTTKLGLKKPAGVDPFLRTDFEDTWDALDLAPGVHICTAATRPAWAAGKSGRLIFETDTCTLYRWSGTTWHQVKQSPNGWSFFNNWADETISSSSSVNKTIGNIVSSTEGDAFYICTSSVQHDTGNVQDLYNGFEINAPGGGGFVAYHDGERSLVRFAVPAGGIPGSPDNDVRSILVIGNIPIGIGTTALRTTFETGSGSGPTTIRHTRTMVWMVNQTNR